MPTSKSTPDPSTEEVVQFIGDTFGSVWSIEVLCHLQAHADRWIVPQDLVAEMRASSHVVQQSLQGLSVAGLVATDEMQAARYAPATTRLDSMASATLQFYRRNPDTTRKLIVAALNPGATAFAQAFKLRKD